MVSPLRGVRFAVFLLGLLPFPTLMAQAPATPPAPPLSQTVLLTPPPSDGPIVIQAGFQLLDINSIDD